MRKLSIKRLVILALISAAIFTVIAFSVDIRAGWAMCLVLVAILCVAWAGVFTKALIRSVLGRISKWVRERCDKGLTGWAFDIAVNDEAGIAITTEDDPQWRLLWSAGSTDEW